MGSQVLQVVVGNRFAMVFFKTGVVGINFGVVGGGVVSSGVLGWWSFSVGGGRDQWVAPG